MRFRWASASTFDFGFANDWMRKNLDYALDEAGRLDLELPVATKVNVYYGELQDPGMNRCDTSVLIRSLKPTWSFWSTVAGLFCSESANSDRIGR